VAQAEVIVEEDHSSKTRRRALLCAGIVVILSAITIGCLLGIQTPTVAPLNNNLCEEAHPIVPGGGATVASLEDAIEQVVVSCDLTDQSGDKRIGRWYKVRVVRASYIFRLILIVVLTSSFLPICSILAKTSPSLLQQVVMSIFTSTRHVIKQPLPATFPLFMKSPLPRVQSHGRQ
jgi:hypothetical protein